MKSLPGRRRILAAGAVRGIEPLPPKLLSPLTAAY